jgi:hypothetical protein
MIVNMALWKDWHEFNFRGHLTGSADNKGIDFGSARLQAVLSSYMYAIKYARFEVELIDRTQIKRQSKNIYLANFLITIYLDFTIFHGCLFFFYFASRYL